MRKTKTIMVTVALMFVFAATSVNSKRLGPAPIEPVSRNNVVYSVPAFVSGETQNGGYIEARNKASGELIWRLKVYKTEYARNLERDIQDVFIISIRLEAESIVVVDDKDRVFEVNMNTRNITRKK